jgi:hypothetical protein
MWTIKKNGSVDEQTLGSVHVSGNIGSLVVIAWANINWASMASFACCVCKLSVRFDSDCK